MDIEDFEVKVKKYDRIKSVVIINLLINNELEIRGFVVRYTTTKYSPVSPVWIVSPPSVRGRNRKYFWIVRFENSALWEKLQSVMIRLAKEHTDT